jgi:hypothetical protein
MSAEIGSALAGLGPLCLLVAVLVAATSKAKSGEWFPRTAAALAREGRVIITPSPEGWKATVLQAKARIPKDETVPFAAIYAKAVKDAKKGGKLVDGKWVSINTNREVRSTESFVVSRCSRLESKDDMTKCSRPGCDHSVSVGRRSVVRCSADVPMNGGKVLGVEWEETANIHASADDGTVDYLAERGLDAAGERAKAILADNEGDFDAEEAAALAEGLAGQQADRRIYAIAAPQGRPLAYLAGQPIPKVAAAGSIKRFRRVLAGVDATQTGRKVEGWLERIGHPKIAAELRKVRLTDVPAWIVANLHRARNANKTGRQIVYDAALSRMPSPGPKGLRDLWGQVRVSAINLEDGSIAYDVEGKRGTLHGVLSPIDRKIPTSWLVLEREKPGSITKLRARNRKHQAAHCPGVEWCLPSKPNPQKPEGCFAVLGLHVRRPKLWCCCAKCEAVRAQKKPKRGKGKPKARKSKKTRK